MQNEWVTINSRKYDLNIRRSWECRLIERSDPLLVFAGKFDRDVEHRDLGFIAVGTISYEYYWLDRWYNVFRFHEPGGAFRNYYCNVNMPPTFQNGVLDYVDLDIDVVVWPDGRVITLDEDDFEANAALFKYPEYVHTNVRSALAKVHSLIETRQFPFDVSPASPPACE